MDALIVAACRTAIARSGKGSLATTSAMELADVLVREAVRRSGLAPERFDDVILGESLYGGGDLARYAALTAGMTDVPGLAVNRHCASGLSAVTAAAAQIRAGMADAIVAGGVQSGSTMPLSRWRVPGSVDWIDPWLSPSHPPTEEAPNDDMSITVGWNAARLADVSRADMDAWALRSHHNALAAIDEGRFRDEVVPVPVRGADGATVEFTVDEQPRRDTSLAKLAALKPLHPEIAGFSITAGNASGVNDGAAALAVCGNGFAERSGLRPLAIIRSWASTAIDPVRTAFASLGAVDKALSRAGIERDEVRLWEINEAFAAQCVACVRALGIDPDLVNISGSGVGLGHPIAATGARMITTLLHDLRRRGGGIGVATMCAGGGQADAVVIEVFRS